MRALRSKSSVSNTTTKVRKDLNLSRLAGKLASLFYCPADPLGVSTQAVAKWQAGTALPTIDNFVILAVMLDTKIDDILVIA